MSHDNFSSWMTAVDRVSKSYSLSVKGLKNQPFYEGFISEETN
jgi:hypothetical protein